MISRALDENNDLIIDSGRLRIVEDGAEVLQAVRCRLQFYLEEWFLDSSAGLPYFQVFFTKPANLANIESIIKSHILNTKGVESLESFSMNYSGGGERLLSVEFSALTSFGQILNDRVTING